MVKMIVGVILVLAAVYYIWAEPLNVDPYYLNAKRDLITVIDGVVPILVALLGLFVVWLELDELKIEKELKTEERKVARRRRR